MSETAKHSQLITDTPIHFLMQIQEIKEAVELPLTHPELYEEIGIRPPKGVVLYGEPGACRGNLFRSAWVITRIGVLPVYIMSYFLYNSLLSKILNHLPGTGKTLLAKAVANQTSATFLRVVGSELIQKYLGDGPKLGETACSFIFYFLTEFCSKCQL